MTPVKPSIFKTLLDAQVLKITLYVWKTICYQKSHHQGRQYLWRNLGSLYAKMTRKTTSIVIIKRFLPPQE